jgi:hypothetical protein
MNKKTILTSLKIIAGIYLAIILYLFALNGRYENVGDNGIIIFDKWENEMIIPNTNDENVKLKFQIIEIP